LNREGVPGPTGGHWNASAVLGSPKRRNGILNNELYIGQIVYNRQRFQKNPATGKRISRENLEREWFRQSAPELRIIDDRIWEAVQRRRAERGGPHLHQQRRPQRPLSGLIYCGACGARFIVATHDYLRCSARTNRGTCETSRTLLMTEVEQRVLSALRNYLLSPDVVASAVAAYQNERKRVAAERRRSRNKLEAASAKVERKMARLLTLVENGHADPVATGPRINEQRAGVLPQGRRPLTTSNLASAAAVSIDLHVPDPSVADCLGSVVGGPSLLLCGEAQCVGNGGLRDALKQRAPGQEDDHCKHGRAGHSSTLEFAAGCAPLAPWCFLRPMWVDGIDPPQRAPPPLMSPAAPL
jgi:hypothetical protein